MADSYATQLDRVQAAIAAIETGKVHSYSVGNQSSTKLDLPGLYAREERLLRKLARGTDSGRRVVRHERPLDFTTERRNLGTLHHRLGILSQG